MTYYVAFSIYIEYFFKFNLVCLSLDWLFYRKRIKSNKIKYNICKIIISICKQFNLVLTYKTVNLVDTLGLLKGMLNMNEKSHMIWHVLITQIFSTAKKLCFWQNHEKVLNWLNFTNELSCIKATYRDHGVSLCAGVTGWSHI